MKTIALAAVLAVPLAGCSAVSSALDGVGLAQQGASMTTGCKGVTLANYNKIKLGAPASTVEQIIGCQGEQNGVSQTNQGEFYTLQFEGVGDRMISVGILGGKVTNKGKAGI